MPLFKFQVSGHFTYTYEVFAADLQTAKNILHDGSVLNLERLNGNPKVDEGYSKFSLKSKEFGDSLTIKKDIGEIFPDCSREIRKFSSKYESKHFPRKWLEEKFSAKFNPILEHFWSISSLIPDVDIFSTTLLEVLDKCNKISSSDKDLEMSVLKLAQAVDDLNLSKKQLEGACIFQAVGFSVYAHEMFELQSQSKG